MLLATLAYRRGERADSSSGPSAGARAAAGDRTTAVLVLSGLQPGAASWVDMGSRTRDLPPQAGPAGFIRELRYHEAARQWIGLLLMPLYALLSAPRPALLVPGAVLAVADMLVRLYASGYIMKNQELATVGPYSLVRHPLYTGNLLMLAGFTLASGQWWAALVSVLFWWFYYPTAIEYEDRKLRRIFGERCEAWQRATPAVLPSRLLPQRGGQWSLRTSMSRNAEPLVVVYSVVWLAWIYWRL